MKPHFLDLFSGLGGASEAFVNDDNWSVLRIDNNPLLGGVPFTVIQDITRIDLNPPSSPWVLDCIWASPPCTDFSGGFASPKSIASREIGLENYKPDMTLLLKAIEIIEICKPKFWIIENVIGSIRYFREFLGEPKQIIGPYVLWGNFPELIVDKALIEPKKNKDTGSYDPLRSNKRAKVDFEISRALKEAIVNQKSILDF